MNNKIISQEQASKRLKELEIKQRILKAFRNHSFKFKKDQDATDYQLYILENKKEINMLLSIVHWHKIAKKLFFISKKNNP
jgi:hypothetical protein